MAASAMTRTEDPLVVTGRELQALAGTDPQALSLMGYDQGAFHPIPFQIDQRHPDGAYAYLSGSKASTDPDPTLDANDELVCMAADLGPRAADGQLPPGAITGVELEVTDPVDQGRAWAYLCSFAQDPPRTDLDYVAFAVDPQTHRKYARTRDRQGSGVIVGTPLNSMCPDELRLVASDGTVSPDVLDRLKIRGVLKPKFFFSLDFFMDELIKEKLVAWSDGPVRITYRGEGYGKLSIVRFPAYEVTEVAYYRNSIQARFTLDLPFSIDTFVKTLPLKGYLDFNRHISGSRIYSQSNPPAAELVLDGTLSDQERALDRQQSCNWIVGYGPYGCIINRMYFCDAWADVKRSFYLNEDLGRAYDPEDDPGEMAIGFDVQGFEDLDTDKGTFILYFYFIGSERDFQPGQERAIIDILDRPLQVVCRGISGLKACGPDAAQD